MLNLSSIRIHLILCAALILSAIVARFFTVGYAFLGLILLAFAAFSAALGALRLFSEYNAGIADLLRRLLCTALVMFLLMLTAAISTVYDAAHPAAIPEVDYLIVLGAGLNGTAPSQSLLDRLRATRKYMELYPNSRAIVSGGQGDGEDITEAEGMFRWLTAHGIAPERILLEDRATSTIENLRFSMELIESHGGSAKIAILSSEYHLYRASRIAAAMGLEAETVAAETTHPSLRILYYIREGCGVLYQTISGW